MFLLYLALFRKNSTLHFLSCTQVDFGNILNFISPFGTLINSSIANFKLALNGNYNLSLSTQGLFRLQCYQISFDIYVK